jgi:hypothetical protein
MAGNVFRWTGVMAAAVIGVTTLAGAVPAHALKATTLERAELSGLNPDKRAEVEQRMKQPGQTVYEILQTILLNSIKLKFPASQIAALDFNRGVAVVQTADNQMKVVEFDTKTLAIKS